MVLKFMGVRDLGLYSLALMVGPALGLLPTSVAQIMYPRMAESYGRTGNVREMFNLARWPTLLLATAMIPIALVCWHLLPIVTPLLLPRYTEGVRAAQWAIVPGFLLSAVVPFSFFNVVKRQDLYGTAILSGIAAYFGTLYVLVRHGSYLAAFPQAMTIGCSVFLLFSYASLYYLIRSCDRASPC